MTPRLLGSVAAILAVLLLAAVMVAFAMLVATWAVFYVFGGIFEAIGAAL